MNIIYICWLRMSSTYFLGLKFAIIIVIIICLYKNKASPIFLEICSIFYSLTGTGYNSDEPVVFWFGPVY